MIEERKKEAYEQAERYIAKIDEKYNNNDFESDLMQLLGNILFTLVNIWAEKS